MPNTDSTGIAAWIRDQIEGPCGMNDYEEQENIRWDDPERIASAKWIFRCLSNIHNKGAREIVLTLMQRHGLGSPIAGVVRKVTPCGADSWDVGFDVGEECEGTWLTVHRAQVGREPRPGDVLTVLPPVAIGCERLVPEDSPCPP